MTHYELTEREMALLDLLEDPDADKEEFDLLIKASDQEFGRKMDGYATIHERMLSDADMLAKEIKRLQRKKKAIEDNDENLKASMLMSLRALGKSKYETRLRSFIVKDCALSPFSHLLLSKKVGGAGICASFKDHSGKCRKT